MEEISTIVKLATDNGLTVILVGYFLFKDWKFNQQIIDTLASIREVLVELKTWHTAEEEKA